MLLFFALITKMVRILKIKKQLFGIPQETIMAKNVLSLGAMSNYYVEEDFEFVMLDSSVYIFIG